MPSYNQPYMHLKLSAAVKSTRILIGITVAFLVFMTYYNLFNYPYLLKQSSGGFLTISLEAIGFIALFLILRKRKKEKIESDITNQSDSEPVDGQPKDEESSNLTTPTKEKDQDYSLDDSKLK